MRTTSFCILDENGRTVKEFTVKGSRLAAVARLLEFLAGREFRICFEASCGYGTLYDRLVKAGARRIVVAHPGKLRLIFRSAQKTDRLDAKKLAVLLFLDQVPAAHVPPAEVRARRALIEHRQGLVAAGVRAKNSLRALLRGLDIEVPRKPGLWTKKGIEWLRAVEPADPCDRLRRDGRLGQVRDLEKRIAAAEKVLDEMAAGDPRTAVLMTVAGVGPRTAEAFAAYVDDPARFASSKSAPAYFGLVPGQDSSGGRTRIGRITKAGPATVRKLLVEAAWQAIRRSARLRERFLRIKRNDPKRTGPAIVAVAAALARAMCAMMRTGEVWRPDPEPAEPKTAAGTPEARPGAAA